MSTRRSRYVRLAVELLEDRALPSTSPWVLETFDGVTAGTKPADWSSWTNSTAGAFVATPGSGLGSPVGFVSNAGSADSSRAWMNTPFAADVQVRADVQVNSLVPGQVFLRGQNLSTQTPNYYAVSVTRGMQVQIVRVANGVSTVLATMKTTSWFSGPWVQVTFTAKGSQLRAQIFRTDTAQYLNADGTWQTTPTTALLAFDTTLTRGGEVGVARAPTYAGKIAFDNVQVTTSLPDDSAVPLHVEDFSGGLPPGWALWTSDAAASVQNNTTQQSLTGSAGLAINGSNTSVARVWYDTLLPADVEATTSLYLDSLIPAQLFVRGQNLNTARPSYYALSISRGTQVQLLRVVDGQSTVLGSVTSTGWLSQQWVQVSLAASGSTLQVQVYRTDTAQYLSPDGTWQVTPAWAVQVQDSAVSGPGKAGLARASSYAGSTVFDGFFATTVPSNASTGGLTTAANGTLPPGWANWTNGTTGAFVTATGAGPGGTNALVSDGTSATSARAWLTAAAPADAQVQAAVYASTLIPTQVFVRGSNLAGMTPTYYAASVTRGLQVQLLRVDSGKTTVLGTLNSAAWLSGLWLDVSMRAVGTQLQVEVSRPDTGQYLAADGTWKAYPTSAIAVSDGGIASGGFAGVNRPASYAGKVTLGSLSVSAMSAPTGTPAPPPSTNPPPVSSPPATGGAPAVPQHYPWIRIAELAYAGTPLGTFEQQLLKNSVDLVIPNTAYLGQINAVAPTTPQLVYSNVSNIYGGLLTDWLQYARAHGIDPEQAFYHAAQPTPFSGDSPSSQPVSWFWSVLRGNDPSGWTDLTTAAHSTGQSVAFGGAGSSVDVGYTDPFREINLALQQGAGAGWSANIEYATAVDSVGRPTAWATLPVKQDTTSGLRTTGRIIFDPPANWVAASINGGPRLYYVRVRTSAGTAGAAPVAISILGEDYVNARGGTSGVIPVFDSSADKDHDGYLDDTEYAARKPGDDARFAYQSRLFYPAYGQMRFAANPANAAFRNWAVDYSSRYLSSQPQAAGLFIDNSIGRLAFDAGTPVESMANYSQDYASLLTAIRTKVSPKWVLANTVGGGTNADPIVAGGTPYFEEFALRPLAANYTQFEDVAAQVQRRQTLSGGNGYAILDSLPTGGSPSDPRTQIATLAYYYLVANPKSTMLMFNGGYAPATSWTDHWSNAVTYNVGQPAGSWSVLAQGQDPSNTALAYKVYQRQYTGALVLYKPLSYTLGQGTGTLSDSTATIQKLNGTYRPLLADGTLGAPVTQVSLRNGEGAILVKA